MTQEKALFSNTPEKESIAGMQVLYFGEEFCQRRLPTTEKAAELLDFARQNRLKPVLVTPPVTEECTPAAGKLIGWLASHAPDTEIVFNDWGILEMAKRASSRFLLTAGRVRMARYDYLDTLPEEFLAFMKGQGVTRLEFNSYNALLTHGDAARQAGLETAICWPCRFLTYSRYCPQTMFDGRYVRDAIASCGKECEKVFAVLSHSLTEKPIFVRGNAWLEKTDPLPDSCPAGRIVLNDKE